MRLLQQPCQKHNCVHVYGILQEVRLELGSKSSKPEEAACRCRSSPFLLCSEIRPVNDDQQDLNNNFCYIKSKVARQWLILHSETSTVKIFLGRKNRYTKNERTSLFFQQGQQRALRVERRWWERRWWEKCRLHKCTVQTYTLVIIMCAYPCTEEYPTRGTKIKK